MFYGLLVENSAWGEIGTDPVDGKAATREDDESWLLGVEAWVPCFSLLRIQNDVGCGNKEEA